jgi:hypothetical protein
MNDRECFLSVLAFETPDRFPVMEFMGFWPETLVRWHQEGLAENRDPFEQLGLLQTQVVPINFNFIPPFEKKILRETAEHITLIDEAGCTKKIKKNSSAMPQYLDFPIKGRHDFEAIKERLIPDFTSRYPRDWEKKVAAYKTREYPLGVAIRGPFAFCRDFMNFEEMMVMMYDDPELIREMMAFQVDFTIELWRRVVRDVDLDFVYIGEDMAYKTGPMVSPAFCRKVLTPQYRKLTEFLKTSGIKNIIMDSDGCVLSLLPVFVEGGMTGILPMERVAGVDPEVVRKEYPKLQLIGGVDKLKIAKGGAFIDEELDKVGRLIKTGGFIPGFDHSVPPIVSFDIYKEYLGKLKELTVSKHYNSA